MKAKPGRYGIKIWACSTLSGYVTSFQVYAGKVNNSPEKGQAKRVVLDLVQPYLGCWREVTADNLFTSLELVEELWEHKTMYTGTVRSNKPWIPPEFLNVKNS